MDTCKGAPFFAIILEPAAAPAASAASALDPPFCRTARAAAALLDGVATTKLCMPRMHSKFPLC